MKKDMDKINEGRYYTVKTLIGEGTIKTFRDIFDYIPKTVVADHMGIEHKTFEKRKNNPRSMPIGEFLQLADLIGCEPCKLLDLFGPTKTGE